MGELSEKSIMLTIEMRENLQKYTRRSRPEDANLLLEERAQSSSRLVASSSTSPVTGRSHLLGKGERSVQGPWDGSGRDKDSRIRVAWDFSSGLVCQVVEHRLLILKGSELPGIFISGPEVSRRASPVAQTVQETQFQSLGWEDPLEKGMATYSGVLAWRVPWTEGPGELQSLGSQRVRHDWVTNT